MRVVGHGQAERVENRLPGADVNPYLALAAMIAAGLHGIDAELELEPPLEGNAYTADKPHVATNMYAARDQFAASEIAREAFGQEVRRPLPQPRADRARRAREHGHRLGALPGLRATLMARRPVIGITRDGRARRLDGLERRRGQRLAADLLARRLGGRRPAAAPARPTRRAPSRPTSCSTCSTASCSPAAPTSTPPATAPSPIRSTKGSRAERDRFELALCHGGARARAAAARRLPRDAAAQRRLRRHARAASPGRRAPPAHAGTLLRPRRPPRARLARRAGRSAPSGSRCARTTTRASAGSARGSTASGWAEPGETIEAIETAGDAWALGILWHAEEERRESGALRRWWRRRVVRRSSLGRGQRRDRGRRARDRAGDGRGPARRRRGDRRRGRRGEGGLRGLARGRPG